MKYKNIKDMEFRKEKTFKREDKTGTDKVVVVVKEIGIDKG